MPQTFSAGLPNITGRIQTKAQLLNNEGAFTIPVQNNTNENASGNNYGDMLGFDASLSSAIYGASDTVQPPSIALIPQIRF